MQQEDFLRTENVCTQVPGAKFCLDLLPGQWRGYLKKRCVLGTVHTWYPGRVPEYGTHWVLMWTHPFFMQITTLEFGQAAGARVQGLDLVTRAQKWAPGPCVHAVFVIQFPGSLSLCSRSVLSSWSRGRPSCSINSNPVSFWGVYCIYVDLEQLENWRSFLTRKLTQRVFILEAKH